MENWLNSAIFPEKYEISDKGRIRSKTRYVNGKGGKPRLMQGKVLATQINRKGYETIALSTGTTQKTYTVHQLVMMAFDEEFVQGIQINHIDGNKTNNSLDNLEVSNNSHNQFHAVKTGLKPKKSFSQYNYVYFVKNPKATNKWAAQIRHNGKNFGWKTFPTEIEAAKYADYLLDSVGDTERNRNFP